MYLKIDKPQIVMSILLFVIIYLPPIFKINTIYIIGIVGWFYLFLSKIKVHNSTLKIFAAFLAITIYLYFNNTLLNGGKLETIADMLYITLCVIPGTIAMAKRMSLLKYDSTWYFEILVIVGMIQSVLCCLAYFLYDFQSLLLRGLENVYGQENVFYWRDIRMYGLANGMTYSMPVVQAVIGTIAFDLGTKRKNPRYY